MTAGGHLHAVTYHVYSEVNRANYNDAQVIDHALTDMSWYVPLVRELAPAAQIWAGGGGPIGGGEDGTCGGEAGRGGEAYSGGLGIGANSIESRSLTVEIGNSFVLCNTTIHVSAQRANVRGRQSRNKDTMLCVCCSKP